MEQLIVVAVFSILLYVLLIMPQQKRVKAQTAMQNSLNEGDHVLTASGMYGNIVEFEGPIVWLEIARGVEIKVLRESIQAVAGGESSGSDATGDADEKNKSGKKSLKDRAKELAEEATGEADES